ncbi:MAG: sigma-70 family RNA polymerase sigma factor [Rhodospirillaceae bacterium]
MARNTEIVGLYVAHRSALVEYASGITGDRAHAEDLVQEAWLRLDRAAGRRGLDEPLRYLYRIVRNLALDGHRRTARERRVVTGDDFDAAAGHAAAAEPSPETVALYRDELDCVLAAMAELPERTRIAVEMHRIGGCRLREIAAFLDISVPLAHLLVADGVEHCKHRLARL